MYICNSAEYNLEKEIIMLDMKNKLDFPSLVFVKEGQLIKRNYDPDNQEPNIPPISMENKPIKLYMLDWKKFDEKQKKIKQARFNLLFQEVRSLS